MMDNIQLDICDKQDALDIDHQMIQQTVEFVANHFSLTSVAISLAIIDDEEIQELKGRYFGEYYATDVISFDLSESGEGLDCEVVVNAQRAKRLADEKNIDPRRS